MPKLVVRAARSGCVVDRRDARREHACDDSVFTKRRVYYRTMLDTRACSPCTCAADGCTYSWRVYNQADSMCASPLLQLSAADQCAQINPAQGKLRVGVEIKGAGACAAAGGASTGSVCGHGHGHGHGHGGIFGADQ